MRRSDTVSPEGHPFPLSVSPAVWIVPWTWPTARKPVPSLGGSVRSSPAVGADGTVYVGSGDNNVYALE